MITNKKFTPLPAILILLFLFAMSLLPQLLLAQTAAQNTLGGLDATASKAGLIDGSAESQRDLPTIIGQAVNYLFGVIGVVFLTVTLIGGYLWMTAGGNEDKVKKAKEFVINGINGMIVIFLAYALVFVILASLRGASGG